MRASPAPLLLVASLVAAGLGPGTARGATTWADVYADPGQKNNVYALHATDGEHAFALATKDDGQGNTTIVALRTTTGTSWSPVTLPQGGSYLPTVWGSVIFTDSSTGYLSSMEFEGLSPLYRIYKSTNGGTSFAAAGQVDGLVEQFQHLPSGDLYGVGDGMFMKSPDGASWTSVPVDGPSDRVTPQGLYMLNPDCGWLVGGHFPEEGDTATDAGAVWYTSDGGDTWTIVAQDLPYALRRVHFVAGNLGWAVGSDGTRGIIVRTDDGGATWNELAVPDHPARPDVCVMSQCLTDPMPVTSVEQVRFWDPTRGIALALSCTGGCGFGEDPTYVPSFLRTYDGGATWELDEDAEAALPDQTIGPMTLPGLMTGLYALGFYDPNKGFLGGQHTAILRFDADFLEDAAQSGMPGCESTAGDGGFVPHGDGGAGDGGTGPNQDPDGALYGCGCAGAGAADAGAPLVLLLGLALLLGRRRR